MKKMTLLLGFSKMSEAEMIEQGASVVEGMTNNSHFTTLTDAITSFTTAYRAFVDSIPAPNVRNQVNASVKDAKKAIFLTEMVALGNLIMGVAKGDEVKLKSTGYRTSSTSNSKKPVPATPEGIEVFITNDPFALLVSCPTDENATSYIARVIAEGVEGSPWENFSSSTKVLVGGITTGIMLSVQMKVKNSAGESGWSNPVGARLPLPSEPILKRVNI